MCPPGIIFIDDLPKDLDEKEIMKLWTDQKPEMKLIDGEETVCEDLIRIGRFVVHIGANNISELKKMRSYWPKEDYRLLKNRKTARLQRLKKKVECNKIERNMT